MILADASIWIDHLRSTNAELSALLENERIVVHPFIIGELFCGHLRGRRNVLADFQVLPAAIVAQHDEVMHFVDRHQLWGTGIGWIDAHLLASARLSHCSLWTLDEPLRRAAHRVGAGYGAS